MRIIILIIALVVVSPCYGAVIFEDSFDAQDDWTVLQPSDSNNSCYPGACGTSPPSGWTTWYNGFCHCDNGLGDEPGNNNFYVDQYAGYPDHTNTCFGGSGKCATFWAESCDASFDNSDGNIGTDLGSHYTDVYMRWYIRFKSTWEFAVNKQMKLYHMQAYDPDSEEYCEVSHSNPYHYFGGCFSNQPISSGGLANWDGTLFFYAENRPQCEDAECTNYSDNGVVNWSLGSYPTWAQAAGGIFDGDWHTLELRIQSNTIIGTADGVIELWYDGNKIDYASGYEGDDLYWDYVGASAIRGFRLFSIGGNNNNQFDTSCSDVADCEQWYAIDDVVISDEYIGTDYEIGGSTATVSGCTITGGTVTGVRVY